MKLLVKIIFSIAIIAPYASASELTISGDIILEWEHIHTCSRGHKLRGSGTKYPTNEFTTEVDVVFDYLHEPTYSRIHLEFEDDNGILRRLGRGKSGTVSNRQLVEAFIGYHLMNKRNHSLDLELGRRRLFDLYDSKVEFESIFDGISLSYYRSNKHYGSFQGTVSSFVVDENRDKFGAVSELDYFEILGSPFDLKYSLIYWDKSYLTSQILAYYQHAGAYSLYMAYLFNHKAKTAKNGFYAGATLGQVKKKGDWSFDCNYQMVQAYLIPPCDVAGMGRDDPSHTRFLNSNVAGTTNYKGYVGTFNYALTDKLTVTLVYEREREASAKISGKFRSSTFEISTTFTF
jgi:hypothetical protein